MSLWGYDVVFFRVICVSLVAIAFIFTVILTNVFVDVDGYLMPKTQNKQSTVTPEVTSVKKIQQEYLFEEQNYIDDDSSYRSRRSLDAHENISTKRNPNINKALSNQLAELLEELDNEEFVTTTTSTKATHQPEQDKQDGTDKNVIDTNSSDEVIHRVLHEILLEGLREHRDFYEIYKSIKNVKKVSHEIMKRRKDRSNEEHELINEILKCKILEDDVEGLTTVPPIISTEAIEIIPKHDDHSVIVKSEVQIWNNNKKSQQNFTTGKIKGFVKMIYNGKLVNLTQMQNDLVTVYNNDDKNYPETTTKKVDHKYKNNDDITALKKIMEYKAYLSHPKIDNNLINKLFRRFSFNDNELHADEVIQNAKSRHKRQINNYLDNASHKSKDSNKNTKNEENKHIDIEIETHFDSKDIKGERKQFISHLIDKIRNALRSDTDKLNNKIQNDLQLKKRLQDPIPDSERDKFKSKVMPPLDRIERRELDSIGKILYDEKSLYDKFEEKTNRGPKFLTSSKTVNSAEMQKVNINYDPILDSGIAKRFQKPIADASTESDDLNSQIYSNLGNVSLLLKNIDGTGFSVGYNQYLDDPPDKESLKAFNGLESLIKEYHNVYDYNDIYNHIESHDPNNVVENEHKITKRHVLPEIINQSKEESNDNLLNSYNLFLLLRLHKPINVQTIKKIPTYVKYNKRNKRTTSLSKINNLKHKINRYIYRKFHNKNQVSVQNRRNKRHIDNIRIIAKNKITPIFNSSFDDIYLERENTYSNKASYLKQLKVDDITIKTLSDELFDNIIPFNMYNVQSPTIKSLYDENSFNSQLKFSKYPHIFIENNDSDNPNIYKDKINDRIGPKPERIQLVSGNKVSVAADTQPEVQDIMNAIIPKSRYKISLKLLPGQNDTNDHTGFKEIHTSVNKSFDKNGLHYFTLLNLTAVSKVEKLNTLSGHLSPNVSFTNNFKNEGSKEIIKRKHILTQQKQKVDDQLANLIKESRNLDDIIHSIYSYDKNSNTEMPNIKVNTGNSDNEETKSKDGINSKKTIDTNSSNFIEHNETSKTKDEQKSTTKTSNENLTAEILKRIDTNTNILKSFLAKLYNKIEIVPQNKKVYNKEQVTPANSMPIVGTQDFFKLHPNAIEQNVLDNGNKNDTA